MPAVQTTYLSNLGVAYEGMIANQEPNNLISREVQTAAIGFGKAVKQGTADRQVQAATAATDVVRGITVRTQSVDPASPNAYPVNDTALVITDGVVWVTAGANIAAAAVGTQVYMVVGTAQAGKFTTVSASNLLIPGATFETAGASDALVAIRLRG